jgi:hypothetical protein
LSDTSDSQIRCVLSEGLRRVPGSKTPRRRDVAASRGVALPFRVLSSELLAPVLVGCAPHALFAEALDSRVFTVPRFRSDLRQTENPLVGLCSPSEYAQALSGRLVPAEPVAEATPPLRFFPLQRFPVWSSGLMLEPSTAQAPASPGFLNLLTRSSAPYLPALFHAGSAHGVSPSELCSSCVAARRCRRPSPRDVGTAQPVLTTEPRARHRSELRYQSRATRTDCENLPHSPVFRGLIHTGVRHSRPAG